MRMILGLTAAVALAGSGFAAGRVRPTSVATPAMLAVVADAHANHELSSRVVDAPSSISAQQAGGIPASAATAAARLAASPRHAEWVAIRLSATDSVMAWVVYPERKDKAPVVIALHANTGLNTWTRSVADQLAADGYVGIAPDLTTMFRTGDLKADPAPDQGRAAIGLVTPAVGTRILDAVAKYGMSLPAALPKYGIVGFCWGGGRSFLHATTRRRCSASMAATMRASTPRFRPPIPR